MKGLYEDRPVRRDPGCSVYRKKLCLVVTMVVLSTLLPLYLLSGVSSGRAVPTSRSESAACDTVDQGYQCFSQISHLWGQYAPYFSVANESAISPAVPDGCRVTFAQVLSRHGARYPSASKGKKYSELIAKIQANATTSFEGAYAFLNTYNYTLGTDDLVPFGEQQMVNSGVKFYQRYESLAKDIVPFIRSSGSDRVIASGNKFIEGFQSTKLRDPRARPGQAAPHISVVISEASNANNTLDPSTCAAFEDSDLADDVEADFESTFVPAIRQRLEAGLEGATLTDKEVIYLMDMCSFDTIAKDTVDTKLSPFCYLFTHPEWSQYNYLQSLNKYYGHGAGNPLGSTQGVGYANELIARLTHSPVHDDTSSNHTLDSNPASFPLNATLYADFSHDNGITSILFALGLYNVTTPLSTTAVQSTADTDGYSAAWTVPFAARVYIEMMQCEAEREPLVRVLVNDRVVPLHGCQVDRLGRCTRDDFVNGLSFAREGGDWGECSA
ncbi:acid phosphatase [Aspergillus heteromorphus CBS 117.55]|uniref:Phytase A n=1 Tax=Aspergillus heteromorphus CBS 117.55 TaxID=1448321 RepID=A0A317WHR9_9EURO|nr:acid phosphatase [Aspergillus heteromorphus CBS 117.55]PWY86034.1 acid phosphatase [Aspergillus heteromorphus CBS 117.55]